MAGQGKRLFAAFTQLPSPNVRPAPLHCIDDPPGAGLQGGAFTRYAFRDMYKEGLPLVLNVSDAASYSKA